MTPDDEGRRMTQDDRTPPLPADATGPAGELPPGSGDPAGYELDGIPQAVLDRIGALDVDTASGCG